jgi:hypothetical protein
LVQARAKHRRGCAIVLGRSHDHDGIGLRPLVASRRSQDIEPDPAKEDDLKTDQDAKRFQEQANHGR